MMFDSLNFGKDLPRQAFGSEERDEEMGYYQMGRRLYDPAIGRFMAVDPLFESFPGQSPYAYAFNSPLQWRDPTGMAPQKEKRRDRILVYLGEAETSQAMGNTADDYLSLLSVSGDPLDHNAMYSYGMSDEFHWLATGGQGIGTPGGGSGLDEADNRIGEKSVENGSNSTYSPPSSIKAIDGEAQSNLKKEVEDYYEDYIDFDDHGFLIFKGSSEEISKILKEDPNSNFALLYELANNFDQIIIHEVIDAKNDNFFLNQNGQLYYTNLIQFFGVGVFLPTKATHDGEWYSSDKYNHTYTSRYDPILGNLYSSEQTTAHEFGHAYWFYKSGGRHCAPDNLYKSFLKQRELNAIKKKKN